MRRSHAAFVELELELSLGRLRGGAVVDVASADDAADRDGAPDDEADDGPMDDDALSDAEALGL